MAHDTKNSEGKKHLPQKQAHLTRRRALNQEADNTTTGHLLKAHAPPFFYRGFPQSRTKKP
jgi:hypothetical protein